MPQNAQVYGGAMKSLAQEKFLNEPRWNQKDETIEDADRILLLINELSPIDYWEIQLLVKENSSVFKECFKEPGDVEGVLRPTSRSLNYYLNVLQIFEKVAWKDGVFYKRETPA